MGQKLKSDNPSTMSALQPITDELMSISSYPRAVKSFTPHFATGLGAMGLLGRRTRKAAVAG